MGNVILVLHGWGGNKPEHWQEHLVLKLATEGVDIRYPKFTDPKAPNLAIWLDELSKVIEDIPEDAIVTVLAHSLGSILWMHYAAEAVDSEPTVRPTRVLLVAPPYVVREIPPLDAPEGASAFFPPPMSPAGIKAAASETILVASDTDDYATFDQSAAYADRLGIPIYKLPGAGHISPYYGYGEWPWVLEWTLGRAELPPLPNK